MGNYLPTQSFAPLFDSPAASCPDPCKRRILVAGPHGSGKTTLLHRLKLGKPVTTTPADASTIEIVTHKNVTFTMWDFVGDRQMRRRLRQYGHNADAVVFVEDSTDVERLEEACDALAVFLNFVWLRDTKLSVLANKQDTPGALSAIEVRARLVMDNVARNLTHVEGCVATRGDGLSEGLEWLARAVTSGQ